MPVKWPEAITVAAIAAVAGVVSALLTAAYTHTSRSRELDIELVKVGIGILRADPKESQTQGAREWAIRLVETHSGQPFSAEAKTELLNNKLNWEDIGSYGQEIDWSSVPPEQRPRSPPKQNQPPQSK